MAELTYRDAVIRGIAQEMTRDPDVVFLGEDIAKAGGVFKATVGLYEQFGPLRVRDTPISEQAILGSVARTHRLFTVEENPRLCGWGAELVSIVADEAFYELDGPPVRITTPHIPLPAADILEDLALPSVDRIAERVQRSLNA